MYFYRYRVNACACATQARPQGSWTNEDVKLRGREDWEDMNIGELVLRRDYLFIYF